MDTIETRLSQVDGAGGSLRYRGKEVGEVAGAGRLADVLAWLWRGEEARDDEGLGAARVWAAEQRVRVAPALALDDGVAAVRTALGLVPEASRTQLVAATGVFGAWWASGEVRLPDPEADHACDLHRLITGRRDPTAGRALGVYLGTVADHGTNASTFAARVVASTGADDLSAVVAALGALSGPLHGGAPGPVLDMLDAVGTPEGAEAWIAAELVAGRRIMGMGHRVYRARDPRAAVLEAALRDLPTTGGRRTLAAAVEGEAVRQLAMRHPERALCANVEFATAVLLEALGIPRRAFTTVFAMGRVVGWLAHTAEQRALGRLIRPVARYVGPR